MQTHDRAVVERAANGHIAIICHHGQEEAVQITEHQKEVHLCEAANIGDGVKLCLYIYQHLGYCGGCQTYVNKRQVDQKEVHGGVEVWVRADGQDDEHISRQGDKIHTQENSKE